MIDYLYYRFYRLWLHSSLADGAIFMAMLLFSVLLSINIMTVWGILAGHGIVSLLSDSQYYILEGGLIALLSGRFFLWKRYKKIITKYEDESRTQRKAGAWILTIYIILTFVVFLLEALYRQGKI
ncbi:hypothetical protein [Bacteroides sp.]|uniref:hypothetical protein n=1 Tax=Bacteroides sp. TaxID=29523 RepID=UPI003AB917F7